jgi:hypothetical protein
MCGAPVPARRLRHSHGLRHIWLGLVGLAVVLAGAAAGYGEDRKRPVTGGAVRGSSPRRRARVRRTRRKLPPRNGEPPGEPRPPTASHPGRSSPRLLAPVLAVHGRGRQARRAGGAPLKAVEKLVTAPREAPMSYDD